MYIVATFEQTIQLEMALTALEQQGIAPERILAVPINKKSRPSGKIDSLHHADGFATMDVAAILGTCLMLLGAIYGFELAWGPILWGIIGAVSGIILGLVYKIGLAKKRKGVPKRVSSEVVLMIRCEERDGDRVEHILWQHNVLGLARLMTDHAATG